MDWNKFGGQMITMLIAVSIALVIFTAAFFAIVKLAPFSVRKEIEEDQNTSLAILIGSMILGLAIIIAAALHGG